MVMKFGDRCDRCFGHGRLVTGVWLRETRLGFGVTLAEISERLSLSIPFLSDVERGKRRPTEIIVDEYDYIAEGNYRRTTNQERKK